MRVLNMKNFGDKVKAYLRSNGIKLQVFTRSVPLDYSTLSKFLNGKYETPEAHIHIQNIVRALASKGVIKSRDQAMDLLDMVECPHFSESDWNESPLNKLKVTSPKKPENVSFAESQIVNEDNVYSLRNWSTYFLPIREIRPEIFKLGDIAAATFPYVVTPFQDVYSYAIQMLQDATDIQNRIKRGLLLVGESNAGKTRFALEVLKHSLPTWSLFHWHGDNTRDDIPPIPILKGQHIVLFLDDLHEYTLALIRNPTSQFLITDPRIVTLRTLIEKILQATQDIIIVATCRSEFILQVQATLNWLLVQLVEINLPSFAEDPHDSDAQHIIADFEKKGTVRPEDWDGTVGSLILGLSTKNSQYLALPPQTMRILKAMKLLSLAGVVTHTEQRIRAVCANIFADKNLLNDEQIWQESIDLLLKMQFIKEELDENNWEMTLIIRKDSYFDKVISDYSQLHRPQQIRRDLIRLRRVFKDLNDVQALWDLSFILLTLKLHTEVLFSVNDILALETDVGVIWNLKGFCLGELNRNEEALIAFKQASALEPENIGFLVNQGICLSKLGRNEEALIAIERA